MHIWSRFGLPCYPAGGIDAAIENDSGGEATVKKMVSYSSGVKI